MFLSYKIRYNYMQEQSLIISLENAWHLRSRLIPYSFSLSEKKISLSANSRVVTAYEGTRPILWITAGVRRYPALMLMWGVTELLNKGRLNARGGREAGVRSALTLAILHAVILQSRNGLLMHYSSANAASAARVLPRCCALTCPKLRQHNVRETSGGEIARRCSPESGVLWVNARATTLIFRTCTKICVMCITRL